MQLFCAQRQVVVAGLGLVAIDQCRVELQLVLNLYRQLYCPWRHDQDNNNIVMWYYVEQGTLWDDGVEKVAAKKLNSTSPQFNDGQFMKEVNCLTSLKHKNVVRFLGYCTGSSTEIMKHDGRLVMVEAERQRLLCFEFAPQGSLDRFKGTKLLDLLFLFVVVFVLFLSFDLPLNKTCSFISIRHRT